MGNRMNDSAKDMHDPVTPEDTPAPPPGLLLTGHFHQRWPYHVIRRHGSRDWLLTFTLRGRGIYRQAGVLLEAGPGDLLLLEPQAYHDYGCLPQGGWEFLWAHVIARPHWIGLLALPLAGKGLRKLSIADAPDRRRMRAAFQRCHADARGGQGGLAEELALNALEEVLLLASRARTLAAREQPLSPGIRRAVERLAERPSESHGVPVLARLAGLSPSRFAHRFKAETGSAPIAYLLKLRMRQAARLLEFSGRSVKEIAGDVGFESPFYFSRQFRKHFAMSPTSYRRWRAGSA